MVLIRIFDIIQMAAYFKYINGFIFYRQDYLYLDMRAANPWNQGFNLLSISNDRTIPIFTTEETYANKLVRIASVWGLVMVIILMIGIAKTFCTETKLLLSYFLQKNMSNALCLAFYLTIQDIAFYCAVNFYNIDFSNMIGIIFFAIAILLSIVTIIFLMWQFSIVNYKYEK